MAVGAPGRAWAGGAHPTWGGAWLADSCSGAARRCQGAAASRAGRRQATVTPPRPLPRPCPAWPACSAPGARSALQVTPEAATQQGPSAVLLLKDPKKCARASRASALPAARDAAAPAKGEKRACALISPCQLAGRQASPAPGATQRASTWARSSPRQRLRKSACQRRSRSEGEGGLTRAAACCTGRHHVTRMGGAGGARRSPRRAAPHAHAHAPGASLKRRTPLRRAIARRGRESVAPRATRGTRHSAFAAVSWHGAPGPPSARARGSAAAAKALNLKRGRSSLRRRVPPCGVGAAGFGREGGMMRLDPPWPCCAARRIAPAPAQRGRPRRALPQRRERHGRHAVLLALPLARPMRPF